MQFRILATLGLAAAIAAGCASQQKAETASAPEVAPAKAVPAEKPKVKIRASGSMLATDADTLKHEAAYAHSWFTNITSDIFG